MKSFVFHISALLAHEFSNLNSDYRRWTSACIHPSSGSKGNYSCTIPNCFKDKDATQASFFFELALSSWGWNCVHHCKAIDWMTLMYSHTKKRKQFNLERGIFPPPNVTWNSKLFKIKSMQICHFEYAFDKN